MIGNHAGNAQIVQGPATGRRPHPGAAIALHRAQIIISRLFANTVPVVKPISPTQRQHLTDVEHNWRLFAVTGVRLEARKF